MTALSRQPYLLRAMYEWIVDSGLTPYVLIAHGPKVRVPLQHVRDGKIVLNISPTAIRDLELGNEMVTFAGRFSGNHFDVELPVGNIQAIYAKETSEGMMFEAEPEAQRDDDETADEPTKGKGASHLQVIK
ncbi:MAG: ClpXP protease specificity-enhancing factor [Gammaproteobacteria bacterium]|nr:ClpXP protease specificity-enhancing factor [Gammaproteobacteria bacterium]